MSRGLHDPAEGEWNHTFPPTKSERYPYSYMGEDVPEDIHERRAEAMMEAEAEWQASKGEKR